MGRFITSSEFIAQFGEAEAQQIAGNGLWNSDEGNQVDLGQIDKEIAFADELIAGYVMKRHPWLADVSVSDVPNLLKGLAGDIVRYRLRDKGGDKGQVTETVETRYRDALKRLEDIQKARLDVPGKPSVAGDEGGHGTGADLARISGPEPQTASILEGYE